MVGTQPDQSANRQCHLRRLFRLRHRFGCARRRCSISSMNKPGRDSTRIVNTLVEAIKRLSPDEFSLLRRELEIEGFFLASRLKPRWDESTLSLYLGDAVCRRYRLPAKNQ